MLPDTPHTRLLRGRMATSASPNVRTHRGDAPLVPFLDQYALPERFTATITPPEPELPICHLTIAIENGRPVCEELDLQRKPGGHPLSGSLLRLIPMARYLNLAVDHVGRSRRRGEGPLTVTADGETFPLSSEPAGEGHVAFRITGMTRTKQYKAASRAPRGQVSDEMLRQVAEAYRTAVARNEPPTKAVMAQWYASRSTASRWVKRARQEGLLGPAVPRRAGEGPSA